MAANLPETLDLLFEGFQSRAMLSSNADVQIGGYSLGKLDEAATIAQVEALLKYSPARKRPAQAQRVQVHEKRRFRLPGMKKAPVLYQATGLVTLVLATTAIAPRVSAGGGRPVGNTPTLIHQIAQTPQEQPTEGVQTTTQVYVGPIRGDRFSIVDVEDPPFTIDDLSTWPAASPRPTTVTTARALRNATREDPAPTLPPLVIDDGLGI